MAVLKAMVSFCHETLKICLQYLIFCCVLHYVPSFRALLKETQRLKQSNDSEHRREGIDVFDPVAVFEV